MPANGTVTIDGNGETVTFTNTLKTGVLNVSKAVSPVAGGGTVVEFGDTLTYTLTVSATGEATQHNVVVSDYIPGLRPGSPDLGQDDVRGRVGDLRGCGDLHGHPARRRPQDHLGAG